MKVIAVVGGGRNSGKTSTIEALIKELSSRGYKVGTIKQIHEEDFSMDKEGKDTWRHAEAGAKIVVAAAPKEIAAIKRIKDERFAEAMKFLESQDLDFVIVEGNPTPDIGIPKIFAARSPEDLKKMSGCICISTLSPEKFKKIKIPVLHPIKNIKEIVSYFMPI